MLYGNNNENIREVDSFNRIGQSWAFNATVSNRRNIFDVFYAQFDHNYGWYNSLEIKYMDDNNLKYNTNN